MTGMRADGFLGGALVLHQPEDGFRAGLDAVMLAAAVPVPVPVAVGEALELGAGVGTASLCLAWRLAGMRVTGLEIDAKLVDIALANARANGLAERVGFVAGDVFDPPSGLRRDFDLVLLNPPFHDPAGEVSPDTARAQALHDGGRLGDWLRAGWKRTRSHGWLVAILRADRLSEALAALPPRGVEILPLWPKAGQAAKRVVLRARKGAGKPLALLPGLVLHGGDGGYTPEANTILRGEAPLL